MRYFSIKSNVDISEQFRKYELKSVPDEYLTTDNIINIAKTNKLSYVKLLTALPNPKITPDLLIKIINTIDNKILLKIPSTKLSFTKIAKIASRIRLYGDLIPDVFYIPKLLTTLVQNGDFGQDNYYNLYVELQNAENVKILINSINSNKDYTLKSRYLLAIKSKFISFDLLQKVITYGKYDLPQFISSEGINEKILLKIIDLDVDIAQTLAEHIRLNTYTQVLRDKIFLKVSSLEQTDYDLANDISLEVLQERPDHIKNIHKTVQRPEYVDIIINNGPEYFKYLNKELITRSQYMKMVRYLVANPNKVPEILQVIPNKYQTKALVRSMIKVGITQSMHLIRQDLMNSTVVKMLLNTNTEKDSLYHIPENIKNKVVKFNPIQKNIKRTFLPKHLDKIQIALLRYMKINNLEIITVPVIKKANLFNPVIEDLIRLHHGKPLTYNDILTYKVNTDVKSSSLFRLIKKNMKAVYLGLFNNIQTIFHGRKNHIFAILTDSDPIVDEHLAVDLNEWETHFGSPYADKTLVGWIRYTKIDKDIWIDEIQTDLLKDYATGKKLGTDIDKIYEMLLLEFIRNMHKRSSGRIIIPTHNVKISIYKDYGKNLPPKYVYDKLPKKFKFKRSIIKDVSKKVDGKDGWILAHVKK